MMSKAMKEAVYAPENFSEAEAQSKLGKTVRLLAPHDQLPRGEIGHVVDCHELKAGAFEVVVRWDSSDSSAPTHCGFSRNRYERLLSEE